MNLPDVAMVAHDAFIVANEGGAFTVDGTSISSPLWAAYASLVNQQGASAGLGSLGFINPAIYAIGKTSTLYGPNFHDITSGANGGFNAVAGYDLVTGWGSPQAALIGTLSPTPAPAPSVAPTPAPSPSPTPNFSQLQIQIYTGSDDLRADSDLAIGFQGIGNLPPFCLMRSNNGAPMQVCSGGAFGDEHGTQGWPHWSTQVLTFTNRLSNWTWAGSGSMTLTMFSHNSAFESNDNWDIQAMSVTLSNPSTGQFVTLFNVGQFGSPQNSGHCYWRFKPTGSPPLIAQTFNLLPATTPSDGCPND
jgi:hypothetical protein